MKSHKSNICQRQKKGPSQPPCRAYITVLTLKRSEAHLRFSAHWFGLFTSEISGYWRSHIHKRFSPEDYTNSWFISVLWLDGIDQIPACELRSHFTNGTYDNILEHQSKHLLHYIWSHKSSNTVTFFYMIKKAARGLHSFGLYSNTAAYFHNINKSICCIISLAIYIF